MRDKIKANFTQGMLHDLESMHGFDISELLEKTLVEELVRAEIRSARDEIFKIVVLSGINEDLNDIIDRIKIHSGCKDEIDIIKIIGKGIQWEKINT